MLALILGILRVSNGSKVRQGNKMSELAFIFPSVNRNKVGSKNEMNLPPSLSV